MNSSAIEHSIFAR